MKKTFCLITCLFCLVSCAGSKEQRPQRIDQQQPRETLDFNPGPEAQQALDHYFIDMTEQYGLKGVKASHLYAVDFDNDGYTDLVVLPRFFSIPEFYRFDPVKQRFFKLDYFPFEQKFRASFLSFVDLNNNGRLDIVAGTLNQQTALRPSPVKFFKASTDQKGRVFYQHIDNDFPIAAGPLASIAFADFDLDGKLDLYLANWFESSEGVRAMPDHLLQATSEDFIFRDVSAALKGEHEYDDLRDFYPQAVASFGVTACDINQDGYIDFLVSATSGERNKLWLNSSLEGRRFFQNVAEQTHFDGDDQGRDRLRGGGHSFFSACADYNNNGIFDLISGEYTKSYDPEYRDRSSILTGSTRDHIPQFVRSEYYLEDGTIHWTQADRGGFFFDFNLNGRLDLVIENTGHPPNSRLVLFEQQEDKSYIDRAALYGVNIVNPSGVVFIDNDKDGLLDLVVGQTNIRNALIPERVYYFKNVTDRQNKRSIQFYLQGKRANRDALGATVKLVTEQWQSVRSHMPIYGAQPSQLPMGVHFGLGRDNLALKVEVIWPVLDREGENPLKLSYDLRDIFNKQDTDVLHRRVLLKDDGSFELIN